MNMESKGVDNFLKGLFSRPSDDKIADNAFSDCMNVDLNEKFLPKSVKGKIKVNSVALANSSCQGMTIYNNKELGSLMVVACGGYIYYSPLNTDNFQKYKIDNDGTLEDVEIDPDVRVRFAQYNDRIFVFTGKWPVIENEDFTDACILVLYKNTATYINRDSFYAWTKGGQIFYTLSATPANGDVIFTDLYRSKLTATVSSYDSGTDKFTDSDNAEYSRTSSSDKVDVNIPQGLKIGFIHQERLFGLGSIEDENGVYWSQPYDPTRWTPVYGLNYDTVGKDDGEKITGGASFGGAYVYIFKQHNVYRYLTSGDIDQWTSNKVDTTYGCVAHETIRLFNGLLTYLSPDGVAQLNGNSAVLIDEQIKDKTTNVSVGSDIELERSYSKDSGWDNVGATINGITIKNSGIGTIKDIEIGNSSADRQLSDYDFLGDNGVVDEEQIKIRRDRYSIMYYEGSSYDQEVRHLSEWNVADAGIGISSLPIMTKQVNINCVYIRGSAIISSGDGNNGYAQMEILNNNMTVIAQSQTVPLSDLLFQNGVRPVHKFEFNKFSIPANTQYWFRVIVTSTSKGSLDCYLQNSNDPGNGWYWKGQHITNARFCVVIADDNVEDYTYITKEIDTYSKSFNLSSIVVDSTISSSLKKVYFATYDESKNSWSDISNEDIQEVVSSSLSGTGKRYIRIKVVVDVPGNLNPQSSSFFYGGSYVNVSAITNIQVPLEDDYAYQSEPKQITGITNLPKSWGISQFTRTGSDDVNNKATIYMRSGNDTTELNNATYYEINNNEQIPATIGLKCLVQFKVSFPAGSDNEVSLIKIFYYTKMTVTKVCAFVWKDKYRLNMPANSESDENAVEYIYDKNGYWTIKDSENNFDYCASIDDLFSCSANTGIVYKKETGYKNDTENYNCFFVTKRFVLSDYENLYRKFKVRYVSATVNVTVGVSVDDGEFVEYEIPKNTNLIEVIKTLTGIVRGQTVRFRFGWQANDYTQIHNLVWYWKVLRHLNIG